MTLQRVKTGFAFAGMAIAVAGIALNSEFIVWIAITVLGGAVVLRLVMKRLHPPSSDES